VGYVQVTGNYVGGQTTPVTNGTIYFAPVNNSGVAIGYRIGQGYGGAITLTMSGTSIASCSVSSAGSGYVNGASAVISTAFGNGGVLAISTSSGNLTGCSVSQPGTYSATPAVSISGFGQATQGVLQAQVTNGAFSMLVPDTSMTSPTNVCYSVSVVDNVSGNSILGAGYGCVQPAAFGSAVSGSQAWCSSGSAGSGGSCSFDAYTPNLAALALVTAGPVGPPGPAGTNGSNGAPGTTPLISSVSVVNGSSLGGTWSGCPGACVLNLTITAGTNYRGNWTASTAYNVGDIVTNGGAIYISPTAFTSGASFNVANWNVFPSSAGTGIVNSATAVSPVIYPAAGSAVSPGVAGLGYMINPLNQVDSENVLSGFNGVDCNGDSITQAYGLPGVSTPSYSTPGGYCNYVANDIGGGYYRTLGQVGDSSADLSLKMVMYSPTVSDANNPLSLILIGKNDQTYLPTPTPTQQMYYQMYLASAAAWKATPNSRKYLATNWTQSGGTFTLPQAVLYNTTFTGGSGYAVGDTITLTCVGGTGPTFTVGSVGGSNNITSLTLASAGSACTNVGTFPSTIYPTTTSGSGTGATVTAFIGLVQPEIGTTVGSKLQQGSFYVPQSGIVDVYYAQYASSTGAGQFSIDGGSPLVDYFTGSSTLSAQWNGLGPRNSLAGGIVMAMARFTGITPGIHSSAAWTQTAAGKAGIFGMGVPPTVHLRGSSGAHAIIGGNIPNQFNSTPATQAANVASNLLYSQLSLSVAQLLKGDGLMVAYADQSSLDPVRDFIQGANTVVDGCVTNSNASVHPTGGAGCGHDHIAKNFEAVAKAMGFPSTGVQMNVAPSPTVGNGMALETTTVFPPSGQFGGGFYPYCVTSSGRCSGMVGTQTSSVTINHSKVTTNLANNIFSATTDPTNLCNFILTAGTPLTGTASLLCTVQYYGGGLNIYPSSQATSGGNVNSNIVDLVSSNYNGTAAQGTDFQIFSSASAAGTTGSVLLNFRVQNNPLTAGVIAKFINQSAGGWSFSEGATSSLVTWNAPTQNTAISMPTQALAGFPITVSFTTTAVASETVTMSGMLTAGHCNQPSPTNSSAASSTLTTPAYITNKTTNQVTFNHAATAGMTFDLVCFAF
jgi:hypothetical protein